MKNFYLLLVCSLMFSFLHATNYYVDAVNGSNGNDGLSSASAKATIQAAADLTNPGDSVFIMAGNYLTATANVLAISNSGNATSPIVYTNYQGSAPKLKAAGATTSVINIAAGTSYITINGLEIEGNGVNLSLATDTIPAQSQVGCAVPGSAATSQTPLPKYSGYGIVADSRAISGGSHHITISNCKVHDCAAAGIGFFNTDYITINNNTVFNNSWYSIDGTSGIWLSGSYNLDANTSTYRNIVTNNTAYNNRMYVPSAANCLINNGNGIALDMPQAGYNGKSLAANNILYNNGGAGIISRQMAHVDMLHNIGYLNSTSPQINQGEIYAMNADDIKIYNNILVSNPADSVNGIANTTNLFYDYNIYNGGAKVNVVGAHSFIQDPKFVNPSIDPTVADFHIQAGSVAANTGDNTHTYPTDNAGTARPIASVVDIGAYESSVAGNLTDCNGTTTSTILGSGGGTGDPGAGAYQGPYDTRVGVANQISRHAIIYPGILMANYGIPGNSNLTSFQFRRGTQSGNTQALPDNSIIKIYVRNEANDNLGSAAFDWTSILPTATNPATLVYSGDASAVVGSTGGAWKTVPFQVPFAYAGSNLGVYVEYVQKGNIPSAPDILWYYDNGGSQPLYNIANYPNQLYGSKSASGAGTISNSLTNNNERRPIITIGYCTSPVTAGVTKKYYVNASTGDNLNSGLSEALAKSSIKAASNLTNPGDSVFIMNGTYPSLTITKAGSASGQTVYTNYPGHSPKLVSDSTTLNVVTIGAGANYVTLNGLEIVGYGVNLSLAADTIPAQKAIVCTVSGTATTNVTFIPKYNGGGISVGGSTTIATHHVIVSNNKVHDCASVGIGVGYSDYITLDKNTVYNNSWYTPYGTSGISFGNSINYDNNTTTYRNIVSNNICYGNRLYVLWRGSCTISDGNGIILDIPVLDVNKNTTYTGKQLVVNNICFNNGGSGIHAIQNNNVDFINNTAYMNAASPTNFGGSIYTYSSVNPSFYNNIIVARTGKPVNKCPNSTNVFYDYNVYYGGTTPNYVGIHSLIQDPGFVNPSTDPTVADFHLMAGGFAVNNGDNTHTTSIDREAKTRPIGGTVDMGAYESNITGNLNNYTDAPTTVQLAPGAGGGAGNGIFYGPYYSNTSSSFQQSRFAYVYPQPLLANYGVPATCLITSLQFNRVTATAQAAPPNSTVRVYLRNEPSNNFGAANFDWTTILPGATNPAVLVYGGDATPLMGTVSDWQTVNFQVPFNYTGGHLGVYIEYLQNGNIASGIAINWAYDNNTSNGSFYSDPNQANSVKFVLASGSTTTISNTLNQSTVRHPIMKVGYTNGSTVILPVVFTQFNAIKSGTGVYVNWITASESNNAGFDVQRSADGINFTTIGFVASKAPNGTTSASEYYDLTDANPLQGVNYYRLAQKDKDGKQTISAIVSVNNSSSQFSLVTIYPNPVSLKLTALVNILGTKQVATVSLFDLNGKVVVNFQKQLPIGYSNIELDVSKLANSIYTMVVELASGEKLTKKFIKD